MSRLRHLFHLHEQFAEVSELRLLQLTNQREPVEEPIAFFTAGFGNKGACVACGKVDRICALTSALGPGGVGAAPAGILDCAAHDPFEAAMLTLSNKSAKRALTIPRGCIDKNARHTNGRIIRAVKSF